MDDRVIADMARLDQFINGVRDGNPGLTEESRAWIIQAIIDDSDVLLLILELLQMAAETAIANED